MQKPTIGITMGDPSGIGPEIIIKAFMDDNIYRFCNPVVIGDINVLSEVIKMLGLQDKLFINLISAPEQFIYGKINLISLSSLKYIPAYPQIEAGKAMVRYIEYAVDMAKRKIFDAIVTCPINKSLMHKAGFPYDGHTPFIAHLTGVKDYVMMLAGERLRVSLVTIHCALRNVPDMITEDAVYKTIAITARSLKEDFGIDSPRIAVAGLNPHAGEAGLFGYEERIILDAIMKSKKDTGMDISGPFPPDTIYFRAYKGEFDAVISMYHDQGLIPLKLLHFSDAVNITLGLPIIRTSVDHGTAYDIAGKGIADSTSLKSAIRMAAVISENRKNTCQSLLR